MTAGGLRWSVMIPTFDPDPRYLREAVDSVRAALPAAAGEIVIVDDDSGDAAALAALGEQAGRGVGVQRCRPRAGLAGNFNRCIELAGGELVHILHQDDRVLPGFYQRLAAAFEAHPGLGAAATEIEYIDADGRVTRRGHCTQGTAGLLEAWIENVVVNLAIQCAAIVVHRETYRALGGFRPGLRYALDWEMWARIARSHPIWFDPAPLAQRREHPASESARLYRRLRPWIERRACAAALTRGLPPPVAGRALAAARGHLVRLARLEGRRAWAAGDWRGAAAVGLGALWVAPVELLLRRWVAAPPPPVPSRAPARRCRAGPRRPRILMLSEFLPVSEAWAAIGVFQRWGGNLDALTEVGEVDAVFLLREERSPEDEARLRRDWPATGAVRLLRLPARIRYRHRLRAAIGALRGWVSYFDGWPDLRIAAPPVAAALSAALVELQPDLVFAHRLGACAALAAQPSPAPPIVTDFDDIEHCKYRRFARSQGRYGPRRRLLTALARHADRLAVRRSRLSLACSEIDARRLAGLTSRGRIAVVGNPARPGAAGPLTAEPQAMFVGVAFYPPNARAIHWLCREIWPLVRAALPAARLVIAGIGTDAPGIADPALGIEARGYVEDLEALYRTSRVALCPVREGSGTRIKLIEAALRGRPAVSTTVGAEGLVFRAGSEMLIADGTAEFAAACVELLRAENGRAEAIGLAALLRAREAYDPAQRQRRLAALLTQALGGGTAAAGPAA
jgi:glycosyltransferase involved in cell wall biosynthesis